MNEKNKALEEVLEISNGVLSEEHPSPSEEEVLRTFDK